MTTALREKFVKACKNILAAQDRVQVEPQALRAYAQALKNAPMPPPVPDWKDNVSAAANSDAPYSFLRAFYEMAMITANQGGFVYAGADGQAQKWQIDGSGSAAMIQMMKTIRDHKALPFYDIAPKDVDEALGPLLQSVPFKEQRLKIFKECADEKKHAAVQDLLIRARRADGVYVFTMETAVALMDIFPAGFSDPFMKKAILTLLAVAAHAHHHGVTVDVSDLTVAADYVLPRALQAVGILTFAPGLARRLEKQDLFDENAKDVTALRAAAIVVAEELVRHSGLTVQHIDNALWRAGRAKDLKALPHMMCRTLRF